MIVLNQGRCLFRNNTVGIRACTCGGRYVYGIYIYIYAWNHAYGKAIAVDEDIAIRGNTGRASGMRAAAAAADVVAAADAADADADYLL